MFTLATNDTNWAKEATYRPRCFLGGAWGVAELHIRTTHRVLPVSWAEVTATYLLPETVI